MGVKVGNRPINRNPFRRRPWRKSRRKVEWFDGLSAGSLDREDGGEPYTLPCIIPTLPLVCDSFEEGTTRSTFRTVWSGPADAEHIDDSNALIERIVGSIEVRCYVDINPNPLLLPLVRFGLLAIEEAGPGDGTEYEDISLFENEHIQDYEWMWLHQATMWSQPTAITDGINGQAHIDLDVRVRRKLGRQDAVLLFASFVTPVASNVEPPETQVHSYPFLRVLHSIR